MEEITGINHVGLRVRDLDISREFYEKLGFKFIIGPVGPEPVAIVEHPSGVNFNLILNASDDAPSSNVLMEGSVKYPGYGLYK
jgi:lactoylglutathione lyase